MNFEVVAVNLDEGSPGQIAYANTMDALNALESDGQLDRVKLDGTVMVKPNFTQPPNPSLKFGPRDTDLSIHNHVCTDPFSIKAACEFITSHGGSIILAEGTKWPGGTRGVYLQTGCEPLLENAGVRLFDTLTSDSRDRTTIAPSKAWNADFATFEVNSIFGQIDAIINMAKLKSHSNALVSGAVKNLYGALEPANRRAEGHYCADPLWASISRVKMAEGYKKLCETFVQVHDAIVHAFDIDEICIIEGVISGEGDGPLFRPALPRTENIVLASVNNPATIDAAESYFMGYSPDFLRSFAEYTLRQTGFLPDETLLDSYAEQYFLKLARDAGMGVTGDFKVYAMTPQASEIIPCRMTGLLRKGEVFALPTFVRYAANTPLFDRIPDPYSVFKVDASA